MLESMPAILQFAQQALPVQLLSIYKPALIFATLVPYAWIVSARFEKDAGYFNLGREKWAAIFLTGGVLAIAAVLLIPWFWAGWPVMVLLLAATLFIYISVRNKSVSADQRINVSLGNWAAGAAERRQEKAAKAASVTITGKQGRVPIPMKEDPAAAFYSTMESWVAEPLSAGAWRVDIVPIQGGVVPVTTRDGVRTKGTAVANTVGIPAMDILRKAAGLDVEDRRKPQRGTLQMGSVEADSTVTVTSIGASGGMCVRLEFDSSKRHRMAVADLGFIPAQIDFINTFGDGQQRKGVVLISAPAGHGLVTTLYAMTSRHDAYTASVKTLEREIEAPLEGIDQTRFDPSNAAVDYPTSVRSIVRRGPDVILVSDISEKGVGAALGGANIETLLTYGGLQVATAEEALIAWIRSCGNDPKIAARLLRGILVQRLVRRVCTACRTPIQVSVEQAKKIGMRTDKPLQLYRAGGKVTIKNRIEDCPVCRGNGFRGQVAAFETIPFPPDARSALEMGNVAGALQACRKAGAILLSEAALAHVRSGLTSYEEIQRVLRPATPAATNPATATKPTQKA
ncbi:MAG: ATPase, T2SS/T4P/T4SS family [Planctomycetota bacterium]|nr:ATPase, T2SS/T4P/T4SS family [Planctomycetota bacterium]